MPLEVIVNGVRGGTWTLLERGGKLHAPADAFEEWRLIRGASSVQYRGENWYALSDIAGFQARLNFAEQTIELDFSPSAFNAVRIATEGAMARPALSESIPAAFFNYDLNFQAVNGSGLAPSTRDLGGLFEGGWSGPWGLLTSSFVARNLAGSDPLARTEFKRLETTFTRNFLDGNTTLRLGDTYTRAGLTSQPVYFGGLQYAKDFSLQPGFITQPVPVLAGVSTAPSTVELFINNSLRQVTQVPPGPFRIDNVPALAGAGEARLVVRDILGRETVITQSLISNGRMLEAGLDDWSMELGWPRESLGRASADYGRLFAAGFYKQGLSKELTLEGNAEVSAAVRRVGAGALHALPFSSVGLAAFSVSQDEDGRVGHNWQLGIERSGFEHGLAASIIGASPRFRQVGVRTGQPELQGVVSYSYTHADIGQIGLSYGLVESDPAGRTRTVNLIYSVRLGLRATLSLLASRVTGAGAGSSVGLTLNVPLDNRVLVTGGAGVRGGEREYFAGFSRSLNAETGWGYRGNTGRRSGGNFAEGGAHYQGDHFFASGDVSAASQQSALRLGLVGGAVLADGMVFATRRVQDSFAIVEVPGYADVGVGFQSGNLTRTDASGRALLPRLLPFQRNAIRLDPAELPISAELDSIEMDAVPALRSAVKITFPVRTGRAALVRVVLDDGQPAPAGAEMEIAGDPKVFYVARRGEAFLTGMQPANRVRLHWKKKTCSMEVPLPPGTKDEIARLGPVLCTGVPR
ncbi:fimbria/pilus outer membrane usher protein [Ramlibacter henchirensis]|nr:fimbria/pilus outer membrane usher protein [Ramlibacter henchirensis]